MLNFSFYMPTTIHFGKTKTVALEGELIKYAKNILILSGQGSVKRAGIYDIVMEHVKNTTIKYHELSGIKPNPRLSFVNEAIQTCHEMNIDFILAVGGGSVIDSAKAIAAGVCSDIDIWEYFKHHKGPQKALPIGTVLTLAATGSEMNGNSVITNDKANEKRACGSPVLIPKFSILNPEFTFSVNAYHTAAGIADIMAHIFETYFTPIPFCEVQNRLSEALLKVCIEHGPICCSDPANYDSRANIMWASTLALNGMLGKGKMSDWVLHALEHELSGLYDISHGIGLAILIPHYMRVFLSDQTLDNYVSYANNVWGISDSSKYRLAEKAIKKTEEFFKSLDIPSTLSELGIIDKDFDFIARQTLKTRGKVGYYKQLSKEQLIQILKSAL